MGDSYVLGRLDDVDGWRELVIVCFLMVGHFDANCDLFVNLLLGMSPPFLYYFLLISFV